MKGILAKLNIDWPNSIISICAVFGIVFATVLAPEATLGIIESVFTFVTNALGSVMLWYVLIGLIICLYLAFGKYGNVKLGDGAAQYSLISYIGMMITSSLASASAYYSLTEWVSYYAEPTFRIEPMSEVAAEYATAYTFFHWGVSAQVIFVLSAIAIAYAVHVRHVNLSVSSVCQYITGDTAFSRPLGKMIDVITMLGILGGLGVTLGLGVPLIANGITRLTGIQETFGMDVAIVVFISIVFSFSSFLGIQKGMRRLSDGTIYITGGFLLFVLCFGGTAFIVKQCTNSFGIMITEFVRMSLWTDPIGNGGFPENWTMFFFAFAFNYAAMMGIFITKVSKGRTIREVVLSCLLGMSAGIWLLFGVNGSFAINATLSGKFDMVANMAANGGQKAVFGLLDTLPGGVLLSAVYLVMVFGLISTSLDAAAGSLASTTTKKLSASGDTSPFLRLFWCIVLAAIPLCMLFVKAPFSAMQTLSIVISIPFMAIIAFMQCGLFKWLKADYPTRGKIEAGQK